MELFHPVVADWFSGKFGEPTEPQALGWPRIREGRDVLVSAPTGSGKTLSAFLIQIDGLVRSASEGTLEDTVDVVYVSPLKALSNDVRKNLEEPLAELRELAIERGTPLAPIRTAVRTGDTKASERAGMLRNPPHILVTTPESLFILLTAEKSREFLRSVRTVIVDEIHAVADDKRGSHLALTLERLEELVIRSSGRRPQRIGLSATVRPIDTVARFLSPRAEVVSVGHRREMELEVAVPDDELGAIATNEMWSDIYDRLATLILSHQTTLVFVNTRRLSERVAHNLEQRLGEGLVLAHHGSLSRKIRLRAEERLKAGELRAVVATASLELGIDIGTVDLVCQIGSPRSIGVALQRVGRSGHWLGATPKGILFATTRDELIECAAVVSAIGKGELDALAIPEAPLDILAQQIVAMAACEEWDERELLRVVRRAYPYRGLADKDFEDVLTMLAEGIAPRNGRAGAYLHRDGVHGLIRGRRHARLSAITSGGAIPDNANYLVVAEPDERVVGTLEEDFAIESMAGDVFLLGTHSWRIRRVEAGRVRVEDAQGAAPTVPFWLGEAPGRTSELSDEVSLLREEMARLSEKSRDDAVRFLEDRGALSRAGAEQAVDYVEAGRQSLGVVPTKKTVVVERFFDEAGGMQLVIHAPFGSRINRAWGLALRKRFCRSFNLELQAAATDDGIVISLSEQHAFPLDIVPSFVRPKTLDHVLTQALLGAPMFQARWRWNLSRSLAILRFSRGKKVPPPLQRIRADDLLAAIFPDQAACAENLSGEIRIPDHPIVDETISDCLHEAMDVEGLRQVINAIEAGEIRVVAKENPTPSPFSHELLNANPYAFLDDAPLEERRARAVALRRTLRQDLVEEAGSLDGDAIALVEAEAWPVVRNADELHDALLTLVLLPSDGDDQVDDWRPLYEELVAQGRAGTMRVDGGTFWLAAERLAIARKVHPNASTSLDYQGGVSPESREDAVAILVRGLLESSGPKTITELGERFRLDPLAVEAGLLRLEAQGLVLRGKFSRRANGELEWCHRKRLARIHRLTLGSLRREIEPVTPAAYSRFLLHWQHLAAGRKLHGIEGLEQVLRQLQGFEVPASAWEESVLPARIADYTPELLDRLCLSGEIVWGRFSGTPTPSDAAVSEARRKPTRVARIALVRRDDVSLFCRSDEPGVVLTDRARILRSVLETRGASFTSELASASRLTEADTEEALWELVSHGVVTADGFENLRALISGSGSGHYHKRHRATGRWALIHRSQLAVDARLEPMARQLLSRWGVVFRDLVVRETRAFGLPWRELLVVLRRLEARGEIRGGRFVAGFVGDQFALPEALELLRTLRRQPSDGERVELSGSDPANVTGIVLPGERVPARAHEMFAVIDGEPHRFA
jgi:ATP-dependent Lhr-like helicase